METQVFFWREGAWSVSNVVVVVMLVPPSTDTAPLLCFLFFVKTSCLIFFSCFSGAGAWGFHSTLEGSREHSVRCCSWVEVCTMFRVHA